MEAAGGLTRVMACNMIQLHEAKGPRTAVAVRLTEMAAVRTVVNPTGAATTSNKWTWLKAAEQNSSAVLHLEKTAEAVCRSSDANTMSFVVTSTDRAEVTRHVIRIAAMTDQDVSPFRLHLATPIVWVPEMPFPGFARLDPLLQRLTTVSQNGLQPVSGERAQDALVMARGGLRASQF